MEIVQARLRKGKDDDLREAFDNLPKFMDSADIVRAALRMYFGLDGTIKVKYEIPSKVERGTQVKPILKKVEISDEELENNLDSFLDEA
ncbi:hypothetical protein [Paenibacillus xylaniclasticus]|uniref:hypothetical protein n=1 Tax=Paenibacillus xylaniclasticus TaxID=588083 RepID=UPI000FD7FDED|nr:MULTISPECIES: hypothetical protein [Paenibacillus]GFN32396.1 hypothetical protein PCURB6_26560 [Paenibacillus curdlanolyticus]